MDGEHDALEGALRRLGTGGEVDTAALAARARARAGVLRRRRRAVAGALALVALAVPTGLAQLDGPTREPGGLVATSVPEPSGSAAQVPPAAMLDTAAVSAALGEVAEGTDEVKVFAPGERAWSTLCLNDATSNPVRAGRTAAWQEDPAAALGGYPRSATETVLVLGEDVARTHLRQVREQSAYCSGDPDEQAPWRVEESSGLGEESVTGLTQVLQGAEAQWTVRVVARTGDLVVDVEVVTSQPDADAAVRVAEELTAEALRRASAGVVR